METYPGAKNHPWTDDIQSVLFKITVSSSKYQQLRFSDISDLSNFGDAEQEVLFTLGSHFKISQLLYDNEYLCWIVEATDGHVLENMYVLKRPFDVEIISLGFYLFIRTDNFYLAEQYYEILLSISNSLMWLITCHVGLGLIEYFRQNYTLALEKFEYALKISYDKDRDRTCKIVGNVCRELKCFEQALQSYELAMKAH